MKKYLSIFSIILAILITFTFSYASFPPDYNLNTKNVRIVLDPANSLLKLPIPLPNDLNTLILNPKTKDIYLKVEPQDTPAFQLLKTAVNNLHIKGLSPNLEIAIPINVNKKLNLISLYKSIAIIPIFKNISKKPIPVYPPQILAGIKNLVITQDGNTIKISFKKPLIPDAKYVVVIKKGVLTEDGDFVGHDPAMEFLMRTQYKSLLNALKLTPNELLGIITFSTASKTLKLSAFSKLLKGVPYSTDDTLDYNNVNSELSTILSATKVLPTMATPNNILKLYGINYFKTSFISYNITTLSSKPNPVKVPTIIIPNGVTNKVIIFQHGLGEKKEHAFALAKKFLPAGYPIIAMDLPGHGERAIKDCNGDGKLESGECFFTTNLVEDRINLYQSVFDLTMLLKNLKEGKFDLNGDGTPDKVQKIYFIGISLGSITGSMFATYNSESLEKIALSVGGADLGTLLDGTKIPSLVSAINSLGLEKGSAEYYVFLGLLHLVLDPADPLYNVNDKIKNKTIVQTAFGDIIVPNSSEAILAGKIGFYVPKVITDFENNPYIKNPSPGWYQFGGIVNGIPMLIPHVFLLAPETEKYKLLDPNIEFDQNFVNKAHDAALDQILNFFNEK